MAGLFTLYQNATRLAKPLLTGLLKSRARRGKEDPARLSERMGRASVKRPSGRIVWVHAASVGEAQSALILIDAIARAAPHIHVVVTTGTVTSATLMERRLPGFAFHQYVPLDHPAWVASFLDHWKPDLALWMESELWPNILTAVKRRNIPAILVNARLSETSLRNWTMAKPLARKVLDAFDLILTQTEKDAANFRMLGARHVFCTDNIKYSALPLPYDDLALSGLALTIAERPVWVYASTHDGEEDLACRVHRDLRESLPDILTIIVPRHPERREEIARTCFGNSLKFRLRSQNVALPALDDDIYIADTLGELGLFYKLCPVAMIGRSFSKDGGGGHNPVEAAQLGCVVLTGPNNQFQRQLYDDMAASGAVIEVEDEDSLAPALHSLFSNTGRMEELREKTSAFAARKAHVIDDVMERILPYLSRLADDRHAA